MSDAEATQQELLEEEYKYIKTAAAQLADLLENEPFMQWQRQSYRVVIRHVYYQTVIRERVLAAAVAHDEGSEN